MSLSNGCGGARVSAANTADCFPEPGEYRLQLFAGDAPLLERRLGISPEEDSETD